MFPQPLFRPRLKLRGILLELVRCAGARKSGPWQSWPSTEHTANQLILRRQLCTRSRQPSLGHKTKDIQTDVHTLKLNHIQVSQEQHKPTIMKHID
eukprot:954603-Amphidinium_carterae.1